ncbi:hypothetical protein DFP72DRAFT_1176639 [Ephemerocybe angulata]|uniref:Uncharacterized protein n=1 Tax=Ephemerocybe angulata TaxID=980116 RepID=A0A8H6HER4_9AGAR|nr:hypothetical protein DFP72DRAFT_1176639 [Tulosesus angulatus]
MEQQNVSPITDDGSRSSGFYLTGIVVERTDGVGEHMPLLNLGELWVFGLPSFPQGISFKLAKASPGRWKMEGGVEVPPKVDTFDFVVKSDDGEALGSLLRTPEMAHECGKSSR